MFEPPLSVFRNRRQVSPECTSGRNIRQSFDRLITGTDDTMSQQQPPQQYQDHPVFHQTAVRTEQHGNQILHVRGDSDSDLDALFSVLHNLETGKLPASSFKNRKLPASFFRQPVGPGHGRSVSSPAQLHQTMPAGGGQSGASHGANMAAGGGGGADPQTSPENFAAMSNCWEATKSCPRYFVNGNNNVGVWQQQQQQQQDLGLAHPLSTQGNGVYPVGPRVHTGPHQLSPDFTHQDLGPLGPLPQGWEQAITLEGELYFINHIDKSTSWYDPRIPRQRQATTPMRIPHPVILPQHHQQQQQQQQPPPPPHLGHMSPKHQQQCQLMAAHQQQMLSSHSRPEHFICLELQKLHKEKERLQHEQDAITCREMMLNELVRQSAVTSPSCLDSSGTGQVKCGQPSEGALAMMHPAMQSLYGSGSGVDPFGSSVMGTTVVESHARQNSTDSGLGGMGTTYSLPRSPDDYLSNVDEMDSQEDGSQLPKQVNSCYAMSANDVTGHVCISSVSDVIESGPVVMDNDQLVSSLPGDFTSDLLSEMDVQKIDHLLWL